MNEDQNLQELFQPIRDEISAGEKLRKAFHQQSDRQNRGTHRLKLALAGGAFGVTTIAVALALLLPSTSAAATFARIESAIADAKAMHIRSFVERPDSPKHLASELFYSKGAWRVDAFPGTKFARTYIHVGTDQWTYEAYTDVAVKEPYAGEWPNDKMTALEFAKEDSDEGRISSPRIFKVEARQNEGDRPVYAVIATRADTPYHLEMVVDKNTNLPIRSIYWGETPTDTHYQVISKEYSFNEKVDASAFSPAIKSTTKLLNLPAEADSLRTAWSAPLKSVQAGGTYADIRDLEVNRQGEVFIACSVGKRTNPRDPAFPQNLVPDELTDDLGRTYFLVETIRPGGVFGDTRARDYMKFGEDDVVFTEWAPLDPTTPWDPATSFDVHLVARTWMGSPTFSDQSISASVLIPAPDPIPNRFPEYSSGLLLDDVHLLFEVSASERRGAHFDEKHDYAEAAKWYRDAATHAKSIGWVKRYEKMAAKSLSQLNKKTEDGTPKLH